MKKENRENLIKFIKSVCLNIGSQAANMEDKELVNTSLDLFYNYLPANSKELEIIENLWDAYSWQGEGDLDTIAARLLKEIDRQLSLVIQLAIRYRGVK